MVNAVVSWCAVVLWMGVIFTLSAIPSLASPLAPIYDLMLRKLAHMGVYAVLTILLFRALRRYMASTSHALLLAVLVAGVYACSDEWHQRFVPGREGSWRDVGIDTLGIASACTLVYKARFYV